MNKKHYEVELKGNTRSYRSEFGRAITSNERFTTSMRGLSQGATAIQGPMGGVASRISVVNSLFSSGVGKTAGFAAALAGLTLAGYKSLKVFNEYEKAQLRTEALVRATGSAAGYSASELQGQADAVALNTLASVQGITEAQNVLLTFKSVSGDAFSQAVELSQDMAAVFGGSAKDKALQLGKALEDPVAGINALKRSGVSFTASQRDMIRSLVETGDVAGAQRVILEQLAGQVGGAGAAEAGGVAGSVDTLGQRWDELLLSWSQTSNSGSVVTTWINNIASGLDGLRGKIAPTTNELENQLASLEAARAIAKAQSNGRSGRRRGRSAESYDGEIDAIRDQITVAKAESGDLDAIQSVIESRQTRIQEINDQIASASNRRRRGGGSEKQDLEADKAAMQAELEHWESHYAEREEQKQQHLDTQSQLTDDAQNAAEQKRLIESEKLIAGLQSRYQQIQDQALIAEGNDAELAQVRYQRKVDEMNAELELLREKGLLTEEIEAAHQTALNNLMGSRDDKLEAINQREIDATLEKYQTLREAALEANEQDIELANLRYEKQLEDLELELEMLREKGLATEEIEAQHKQALEDLETTHQANLGEIRDEARQEELEKERAQREQLQQGYETLFNVMGSYFDGMQGKHAAFARVAISIGKTLLSEEKRKSLATIKSNTAEAAMKAYNAMVGIPFVGPAVAEFARAGVYVLGAASAADVMGIAHSGMTNIPTEGTYILDGGERVIKPEQNKDLSEFLNNPNNSATKVIVNLIEDSSKSGQQTSEQRSNGETSIDVFVSNIHEGGDAAMALERHYGLHRQGV